VLCAPVTTGFVRAATERSFAPPMQKLMQIGFSTPHGAAAMSRAVDLASSGGSFLRKRRSPPVVRDPVVSDSYL